MSCLLCRKCCAAFSHFDTKKQCPAVALPAEARANGLWHGPDPVALQGLSYCECKVVNIARIYVSVKCVFLERSSYTRTGASEAPQYHQNHVIAYPQNLDNALLTIGMTPGTLAKMVVVQFVGGDRQALRK